MKPQEKDAFDDQRSQVSPVERFLFLSSSVL
jgi:hypothetical protein